MSCFYILFKHSGFEEVASDGSLSSSLYLVVSRVQNELFLHHFKHSGSEEVASDGPIVVEDRDIIKPGNL